MTISLLALVALLGTAAAAPLQVFVLAGQSNMEGQAEVQKINATSGKESNGTLTYQLTDPRTAKEFAPCWDNQTKNWTVLDNVKVYFNEKGNTDDGTYGSLSVGFGVGGSRGKIGPEYGFGFHMSSNSPSEEILVIKTAWGGKTLGGDFRPPSSGGTTGFYYKQMVSIVHEVLSPTNLTKFFGPELAAKAARDGTQIAGLGWFQGWNDGCSSNLVESYEQNMVNLIKDLRSEFKNPKMAVSIPVSGFAGWAQSNSRRLGIIEAQFGAANSTRHPELGGHVVAEETRGFWRDMSFSPVPRQGYHWGHNAEAYWLIGQAMAKGMLQALQQ